MKRIWTMLLVFVLLLTLAACVGDKGGETPNAGSTGQTAADKQDAKPAAELGLTGDGWIAAKAEEPYGKYRTVEEWEAIFNGEADYDNVLAPVQTTPPDPIIVDGEEGYTGEAKTVTFSEDNFEEGEVGVFDWKSTVSAEELAEWEAFDPKNPEFQELMKENQQATEALENSGVLTGNQGSYGDMPDMNDVQSQLDEALKQAQEELENADLPEGYEQYLPEGMNLESLLGGAMGRQP